MKILSLVAALTLISACRSDPETARSTIQDDSADLEATLFGQLEMREHTVTIWSTSAGPLYTITAKDGGVLAERIDSALLEARFPRLHAALEGPLDEGGIQALGDLGY